MNTDMFGLNWLQVISFVFAHEWIGTMYDILPVVDISSIMNATSGTWPYLPSWAFVSNSSCCCSKFSLFNVDHCLPLVLSRFDLCPSVCWFWQHKCCLPTFFILIGSQILIVLSTYFIFFSYLGYNQITSIQAGTFNNLTSLTLM